MLQPRRFVLHHARRDNQIQMMDATISTEEVSAALGHLPSVDPRPNAVNIRVLRVHIERALQLLPCPQSVHHGWKGLAMSRAMYALLVTGGTAFHDPVDPGSAAIYTRADPTNVAPLTRTEQATVDATFARKKHYFNSWVNINWVLYAALRMSVNEAFQVSNVPGVARWPAGMDICTMLDQLSSTYGLPTPAVLEMNDNEFRRPYSPADAPEVLFRRIENCAEIAIIRGNPYTDRQIDMNTIRLLLTMGIYTRMFEEWDSLAVVDQTWLALCQMIQEAFQRRLNATAPTAGGYGYAPAYQNMYGALGTESDDDDDSTTPTVATQVATLMFHSQLMASTAATTMQRHEQQLAHLAVVQDATHATLQGIIEGLNAVAFNVSDGSWGTGRAYAGGRGYGRGRSSHRRFGGGRNPYPPTGITVPPAPTAGRFQGPTFRATSTPGGVPPYHPPLTRGGGFCAPYRAIGPPGFPDGATQLGARAQNEQPPYSNTVKRYANWNACYSCGFDVADGHTSMSCPPTSVKCRMISTSIAKMRSNTSTWAIHVPLGTGTKCSSRHKCDNEGRRIQS